MRLFRDAWALILEGTAQLPILLARETRDNAPCNTITAEARDSRLDVSEHKVQGGMTLSGRNMYKKTRSESSRPHLDLFQLQILQMPRQLEFDVGAPLLPLPQAFLDYMKRGFVAPQVGL